MFSLLKETFMEIKTIKSNDLLNAFSETGFRFITGVPDSLFTQLIIEASRDGRFKHVITNNEGESCALAAGYHLATGEVPIVYMQNSGLGNAINPLTSLMDEWVYSIPVLLLIGWRGKPDTLDEPQHRRMGAILLDLLNLLAIPYHIVEADGSKIKPLMKRLSTHYRDNKKPFALVFPSVLFNESSIEVAQTDDCPEGVLRETVIAFMVNHAQSNDVFVTTTGKASRELYEIRDRLKLSHSTDFLTVGSMGCAASIALGLAMHRSDQRVILIDGDGACLMRMEAMATVGYVQPSNLLHVLIDNNAYESTGGQKTQSAHISFGDIAVGCGYRHSITVDDMASFSTNFLQQKAGPSMIVVKTKPYSRGKLGRPKSSPIENKAVFMNHLGVE